MLKAVFAIALGAGLMVAVPGLAQSTDQQRTVRPGDRIEWSANPPHFVQFGGLGGNPQGPLTPLADVDKILSFVPPLSVDGDIGQGPTGGAPGLVATVKDDAAGAGVANFVFTCGQHPGQMKSLPFTVAPKDAAQPPRTLKIRAVGLDWMLDTPAGPVKVDSP